MKKRKKEGLDKEVNKSSNLNVSYPKLNLAGKKVKKSFKKDKFSKINLSYPKLNLGKKLKKIKTKKENLKFNLPKFDKNKVLDKIKIGREKVKQGLVNIKTNVRSIRIPKIKLKSNVKEKVSYPDLNLRKKEIDGNKKLNEGTIKKDIIKPKASVIKNNKGEKIKGGFKKLKERVTNIKLPLKKSEEVKKEEGNIKDKFDILKPGTRSSKTEESKKEKTKETKIKPFKKKSGIYRTDLDDLYDLIVERERVKLNDAVKALQIDKNSVQKWGEILDEHELIHFHFPAFGEPELIKRGLEIEKEATREDVRKRRMVISISVTSAVLLVIVGFLVIMPLFQNYGGSSPDLRLMPPKGEVMEEEVNLVNKAFSGIGSYECAGAEIKYYIKDKLLRVESLRTNSVVVVKEGFIYTYNANDDTWIKSEVIEGMALPGTGKVPGGDIGCKENEVDINLFTVKEGS